MEMRDSSLQPAEMAGDATLNEATVEMTVTDEPVATESVAVELPAEQVETEPVTKEGILARMTVLSESDAAEISSDEISRLKQQFYMLKSEEASKNIAADAEVADSDAGFTVGEPDNSEDTFKALLTAIKEKKAAYRTEQEALLQRNFELKSEIIDKINALSADTDNVNRVVTEARELQQQFKEIGEVSPVVASDLWKKYQEACEHFYDQLKINKELRDYDFKKNLGEKELLIAEATRLLDEPDIVVAFRRLQVLHDKWREIGPVNKELREEIWNRFKDVSAQINKAYQAFFEERKARERANEDAKTALCEQIEALDFSELQTYSAWDEMTKRIIAFQDEWKKVGFASRKNNNALFARFRASCDKFFAAKADFFRKMKESLAENLEKKIALCEEAEALRESTDWRKTSDRLAALQREWKQIGAVAKKHSDVVWKRFLAACDYFFEQKKKATTGTRKAEQENLKLKKAVVDELIALEQQQLDRSAMLKAIRELQARWQQIGHVPFSEKDKVYKEYRAVVDRLYDGLGSRENRRRMESFEASISEIGNDNNRLYRERERLVRVYEQRKAELNTYENNLLFFNSKSKTGDSMLRELQRKIQRIKDDIADLENKIRLIDSRL